jgi:hypothetical protein
VEQAWLRKNLSIGLVGLVLVATGCQSSFLSRATDPDHGRFMSLWETYTSCKVASDLDQASSSMEKLFAAAQVQDADEGFVLPLPTPLERLVANLPNRLAVDVRAMTAACSLHTGQLALHQGRVDVARDAFGSVLKLQQDVSPYYVMRATRFLTELEDGVDLALSAP